MVQIPPPLLKIKMGKKEVFVVFVIVVVIGVVLFYSMSVEEDVSDGDGVTDSATVGVNVVSPGDAVEDKGAVNWEKYNYDYVDENVKGILSSMIGSGKTAFYLPSVGCINVSRGSKYGVAFALNNPNPSGENYFEYDWIVDDSVVDNCGVSVSVGQSWIERGWRSWGKIPQGWIDHMTVYFSFPNDAPLCNIKYNFEIRKDGVVYDTKVVEFNIV